MSASEPRDPAEDVPAAHSYERSYWEIVLRQFQKNRRAVWGLRVVVCLILVAIFAPLIANDKPLVFHGYRYGVYVNTYDQIVYAHADLAGVGRDGEPLRIPELYPDGFATEGIVHAYRDELARWEAGNPTWDMVRDLAFGAAQDPMNRLRESLEEALPHLKRSNSWARGATGIAWLREQGLPADVEGDLDRLLEMTRANLDVAYRAKTERRYDALLQQLDMLAREVSRRDRRAIERFEERYEELVTEGFFEEDPDALGDFDELLLDLRKRLAPRVVTFAPHIGFPALIQLTSLDVFLMVAVLLWATRAVWSWPLGWRRLGGVARTRRQLVPCLALPLALAGVWWAAVPAYNDVTKYDQGMRDGSLYCDFRLMAPLRYGVNQNDTDAKYDAPWWWTRFKAWWHGEEERGETDSAAEAADEEGGGGARPTSDRHAGLEASAAKVGDSARSGPGPWTRVLDVLSRHHMGTDGTGRDLLTRMVWGSRISLSIGFVAVGIYLVIGCFLGSLAGYFGGVVDMLISRVIEVVICFPVFFLILTVIAFLDPSAFNIMVVIGVTRWTAVARLVRGEFLALRQKDFVTAGKALGFSDARIIFRHVLPNALAPVLVAATFGVASAILIESSLSFLGFGVKVPIPTWGSVLSAARESWIYWWITIFPGLAIFLTVTMYNLVGEGIRDAVDPKLRN